MPWVKKRPSDGGTRYQAIYRDPTGRKRSAGTFTWSGRRVLSPDELRAASNPARGLTEPRAR